ncbi:MAG TPA: glycosyltransferase [Chthoniobacterales bacterium]|jgi:glycosyltransferase involved in cell wall biosynthesis|nr:glycosyltransferase [Chthoniobacterales bacterium]
MLSFIVPAYNEELELPSTMAAIHDAVQDRQYEIIVVDDASTDDTAQIARGAGAEVVSINRRQIAAARNAGARHARSDILFFVDADTRINEKHVTRAIEALEAGCAGGSARVVVSDRIPLWARIFIKVFSTLYFGLNLGAGAFLFTTRNNFDSISGFDEKLFVGEEIYFSIAIRRLGRFRILPEPVVTSARKLRMYPAREILRDSLRVILRGPRGARSREGLHIWYEGKRERRSTSTL